MNVEMHRLFAYLLKTAEEQPEAVLSFSLTAPPKLGDYLDELDPDLALDWNNQSFQGLPALREHVLYHAGLQESCSLDDVLITAGAAEANFLVMAQLLGPGDEVLIERPGWPQPWVLAEPLGARPIALPRDEDRGWQLRLEALGERISERTRLIFLTSPNNPTGAISEPEVLREIMALAQQVGAYVLVDEVYAGLEWQGERRPAAAGMYERAISTGSVSKTLGLQGLRTGWLICRDPALVRAALVLRENSSEIMNILGEHVAEIALRPERYAASLDSARRQGLANLALLDDFIDSRPELSWQTPAAGLVGLARLQGEFNADRLAERLLAPPHRTFVIPGSAFGLPQHIRLGVGGGPEVNLEEGLRRLAACLNSL